ncbi:putative purine permease 15 [Cardamine amara subsp. amara]|uniref:Probable purine permease n=1 Tax=Cardamine amara subsp. amara TaxID=228776 RepID=A0ABD1A062_CARAN
MQSNSQEQCVQIPLHIDHNQTNDSNRRHNKWLTIIICMILAVTGQCIARILEIYYFLHRNTSRRYVVLTQSLLQVIGFPILLFPFLLFLFKKQKQLLITSGGISRKQLAILYLIICSYMFSQAIFSTNKHRIPFRAFTLIYTTQLFFTVTFSILIFSKKIKFNRWMIISLIFAVFAGALSFSAGSSIYKGKKYNRWVIYTAFCAALFFSFLLCTIRSVFDSLISICNASTRRKQPSFAVVLELLIFSSFLTTVILVAVFFVSGEHHNIKRDMDGFSKGKTAYVRTMVGQAAAWQTYWVGIVGLVFAVSAVFSNVISVCTWPLVSLLVVFFHYRDERYDVFTGIALAMATLSVASYLYVIHKDKCNGEEDTS